MFGVSQRNAIDQILRYASKNRLPEGLRKQMLAHMQLKFKTAELQQEEVWRTYQKQSDLALLNIFSIASLQKPTFSKEYLQTLLPSW